jgi:hypothetical protein
VKEMEITDAEKVARLLFYEHWSINESKLVNGKPEERPEDHNIYTGKRYKNIIEMRSVKLRWMLHDLPKLTKNLLLINYEDLAKDSVPFLKKIEAAGVALKKGKIVKSRVLGYKRTWFPFFFHKARAKPDLVTPDFVWNHPHLDIPLENQLGYRKALTPEPIE